MSLPAELKDVKFCMPARTMEIANMTYGCIYDVLVVMDRIKLPLAKDTTNFQERSETFSHVCACVAAPHTTNNGTGKSQVQQA